MSYSAKHGHASKSADYSMGPNTLIKQEQGTNLSWNPLESIVAET
jgi:hypothetical protein